MADTDLLSSSLSSLSDTVSEVDMAFIMGSCSLTDLCTHSDDLLDCVSHSRKMYSLHATNSIYKHIFWQHFCCIWCSSSSCRPDWASCQTCVSTHTVTGSPHTYRAIVGVPVLLLVNCRVSPLQLHVWFRFLNDVGEENRLTFNTQLRNAQKMLWLIFKCFFVHALVFKAVGVKNIRSDV